MRFCTWPLLVALSSAVGLPSPPQNQETTIPYNAPDGLKSCLKMRPELEINSAINPYFLSGDFDGDGSTDVALHVKATKDGSQGILVCFAKRDPVVLGGGTPLPWKADIVPFDDWILVRKGSKRLRYYREVEFDSFAWFNGDGRGVLIYWNGERLAWIGMRIFRQE